MPNCLAFTLLPEHLEYQKKLTELLKEYKSKDEIIQILGYPKGVCRVLIQDKTVGSKCNVSDEDFLEWLRPENPL